MKREEESEKLEKVLDMLRTAQENNAPKQAQQQKAESKAEPPQGGAAEQSNGAFFYGGSVNDCKAQVLEAIESGKLVLDPYAEERKKIIRPRITQKEIWLVWFLPVALLTAAIVANAYFTPLRWLKIHLYVILPVVFLFFFIGPHTIFFIRLYQRFARDMLRMSCRFTPTCSQYMILAIKKYGWRRGVLKGIKRLARCKYPNGGEDYP